VRRSWGGDASPSATIIDSQSVETTEAGGLCTVTMLERRSTDVKGHALGDTDGRGLVLEPHQASIEATAESRF
jgi:hypothetical protein